MKLRLDDSIQKIKGIGAVSKQAFEKSGIYTVEDLLRTFPIKYRDYGSPKCLAEAVEGEAGLFGAYIRESPKSSYIRSGLHITQLMLTDADGTKASVRIFNQPYLVKKLIQGAFVYLDGTPRMEKGRLTFSAPSILLKRPEQPIVPIYRNIGGLSASKLRTAVTNALKEIQWMEPYSCEFLNTFGIPGIQESYENMHFPEQMSEQQKAARRFSVESGLILTRILDMLRAEKQIESDRFISGLGRIEAFERLLPFTLTEAQKRVMHEIGHDLEGPTFMNRLVQGDVGSGKTAVALYTMYCAAQDGYQSILLAPTEVLARQHARRAQEIFGEARVALFTGAMRAKERQEQRDRVEKGEVSCVIGTHALFFENMPFHRPGLIIADEQQRFGVKQRKTLFSTYGAMHSLVMSATPIPRSMSLVLQGFMDVSVIDELPKGRQCVQTRIVRKHKIKNMYDFIAMHACQNDQTYIVCPLIEPSEEMSGHSAMETHAMLTKTYPDLKIGLLHGKMSTEEKNAVMESFNSGEVQVLVSTTVIEVGVDNPNAVIMAILDADRFGLAQLHQLRGRVGRGEKESWCFLATTADKAGRRLQVLCDIQDGFQIAEADLAERGAGQLLGLRQHGQETKLGPQDLSMIETYREMLNEMAQTTALRQDFMYIAKQAQDRSEELISQIALN